jgi:hypothetical protein
MRSKSRSLRAITILALALVAFHAPVFAQLPELGLTQAEVPKGDIPLYFVVMHFFDSTAHYRAELPYQYETRLVELGLDPGGVTEDILVDALEAATEILARDTVDLSLKDSEDQFMAYQERALEDKARDLAGVYGELIADLEVTGVAPDRFRAAVDRTVRSKVSLYVEVVPGQDPTDALVAESTIRVVLPFETWSRAVYEARMDRPATGDISHDEDTLHLIDPAGSGSLGPSRP